MPIISIDSITGLNSRIRAISPFTWGRARYCASFSRDAMNQALDSASDGQIDKFRTDSQALSDCELDIYGTPVRLDYQAVQNPGKFFDCFTTALSDYQMTGGSADAQAKVDFFLGVSKQLDNLPAAYSTLLGDKPFFSLWDSSGGGQPGLLDSLKGVLGNAAWVLWAVVALVGIYLVYPYVKR